MKKVNGMTVYEENDICALDEYSEQIEKDITQKIKEKETDIANIQKEQITQKNKITSLETDNTSNKTNITQIKEKNTEQDTKLSKLEIENTELKSENERLREDLKGLPKGTFLGENIDLNDSSEMRLQSLKIGGNSKQETREGYNLLNFIKNAFKTQTINGLTIRNNEDGSFTLNGTTTDIVSVCLSERMKNLEAGIYNVSKNSSGNVSASYRNILYGNNAGKAIELCNFDSNEEQLITLTKDYEQYYFWLYIVTGITFNNYTIKPMLTKGIEKKPYEQYGTMPSPEYPSEVECCGDNINIFEATAESFTYNNAYLNYNNEQNEYHILSSQIWFRNTINNLELNETYTISFDAKISNSGTSSAEIKRLFRIDKPSDGTPLKYFDNNILLENEYKRYSLTFTAIETFLWATIRNTDEIEAYIKDIKITKGTSDTYSKFGQGNISFEMCNKNLAKTSKVGQHGTPIIKFSEKYTGPLTIAMKPISGNTQLNYRFFYADGTAGGDNSVTLVNTENNKWYCISLNVKNVIGVGTYNVVRQGYTNRTLEKQFIAKGQYSIQSDKDYIEHKSQTYTIPVQKPLRKIDTYKDTFIRKNGKRYERHFIYRRIFNGTEDWSYNSSIKVFLYNDTSSPIAKSFMNLDVPQPVCASHYTIASWNSYSNKNNNASVLSYVWVYTAYRIRDDRFTTVEEFKVWLQQQYNAGTPVYFDYILSEPEDIECTAEQTEILDKIENEAKTYKGVTHIYSTDKISPIFEGTYNKDIETMINNISKEVIANV